LFIRDITLELRGLNDDYYSGFVILYFGRSVGWFRRNGIALREYTGGFCEWLISAPHVHAALTDAGRYFWKFSPIRGAEKCLKS
jgi:hypothetical protein